MDFSFTHWIVLPFISFYFPLAADSINDPYSYSYANIGECSCRPCVIWHHNHIHFCLSHCKRCLSPNESERDATMGKTSKSHSLSYIGGKRVCVRVLVAMYMQWPIETCIRLNSCQSCQIHYVAGQKSFWIFFPSVCWPFAFDVCVVSAWIYINFFFFLFARCRFGRSLQPLRFSLHWSAVACALCSIAPSKFCVTKAWQFFLHWFNSSFRKRKDKSENTSEFCVKISVRGVRRNLNWKCRWICEQCMRLHGKCIRKMLQLTFNTEQPDFVPSKFTQRREEK